MCKRSRPQGSGTVCVQETRFLRETGFLAAKMYHYHGDVDCGLQIVDFRHTLRLIAPVYNPSTRTVATMARRHAILVVDDEPDVVQSLHDLLRLQYRVFGATRAEDGIKILHEQVAQDPKPFGVAGAVRRAIKDSAAFIKRR